MKYRVMCLTPTLVGDGQKLSPIDYMVWRDHVNVLDQRRIFKLLAKGPRLDGYLAQLKKADRLDFASWGGFAQNFAGRRIPFENPGTVPVWERAHAENLFIPTFAASLSGPYLPATAVKGALRTGAVFDRWTEGTLKDLAERIAGERPPRNPASKIEDVPRAKRVSMGDSRDAAYSAMKVYLLRVSTLVARGPAKGGSSDAKFELGWKSVRGSTDSRRIEESTPLFAEMATPGVKPKVTAKLVVSFAVISRPPCWTNFCRCSTPDQPRPGRMSSVSSVLARFGVCCVTFQGRGLPYMGRPLTIACGLPPAPGAKMITSYFARRSASFETVWVLK